MTKLMFHFSPLLTRKKWSLKTLKKQNRRVGQSEKLKMKWEGR